MLSRPARGEGKGDDLIPLDEPDLAGTPVLLANPRAPLSTAAVFAAWDGVDRGPLGDWRDGRNDLEGAALHLAPQIADVLKALAPADFARMSGSGATCFGLFSSDADRDSAVATLSTEHPDWWLLATRLR